MHTNQKSKSKNPKSPAYLREIVIRYEKKKVQSKSPLGKSVQGAKQIVKLFRDLQNEGKEKLIVISLDATLKIICFEVVAIGTVASVYSRRGEVIRTPIIVNAYGIVLVHNHPSGSTEPSDEDKEMTARLRFYAEDLGIHFHDHIIIGDENYFSFWEEGLLDKPAKDPWEEKNKKRSKNE